MSMTLAALVCFAANSLLCRFALGEGLIDAATFTSVRLVAGALLLWALAPPSSGGHRGGLALVVYAACFSFAYIEVTAATGALLLFAAVQGTMLVGAVVFGDRLLPIQVAGCLVALAGVGYLLAPGVEKPPASGTALMLVAGAAWGIYTLAGRGARDPLGASASHFSLASVLAIGMNLILVEGAHVTVDGLWLAILSGAVTSALGYVLWFRALRRLSTATASSVQLAVPVLTALGGAAFLAEALTMRFVVASGVVLAGIALTLPLLHGRAGAGVLLES